MALTQSTHNNVVQFVEAVSGSSGGVVNLPPPPGVPGSPGQSTIRVLSIAAGLKIVAAADTYEVRLFDGTNVIWRSAVNNTTAGLTSNLFVLFSREAAPRMSGATPQLVIARLTGAGALTNYSGSLTFEMA